MRSVFIVCLFSLFYFTGKTQPGVNFFSYNNVHTIDIKFVTPNYFDSLCAYKLIDDQTGQETYLKADVIIDSDTIPDVGIRFRGNASYDHPGSKKPIQLDFNEFVSGQEYDNLKKLNFNNSYLDPTQIREKLCLDIFNEMGLPAPRCSYAAVYYNGVYIGLYKAVETINKDFLETFFVADTGNLYKCEPNMPLTFEGYDQTAYYDNCELKSNESLNDWSKLVNLIHDINYPVGDFETAIRPKFNIDNYIKAWAVNMVMGNLDSYLYLPHNYFLYDNPATTKFEWITWDVSLAFGVYALLIVPNSTNFDVEYLPNNAQTTRPLNYFCLNNDNLRKQYLSEICYVLHEKFNSTKLFYRIDSIANVIRPWVQNEPAGNQMFTNQEFEDNLEGQTVNYQVIGKVPGLKEYIRSRGSNITRQLCKKNFNCGINDFIANENTLSIYPNPGSVFNVDFNVPAQNSSTLFTLRDFTGRTVYNNTLDNGTKHTLDLSHLPAGVYFFDTKVGCEPTLNKIVVVK